MLLFICIDDCFCCPSKRGWCYVGLYRAIQGNIGQKWVNAVDDDNDAIDDGKDIDGSDGLLDTRPIYPRDTHGRYLHDTRAHYAQHTYARTYTHTHTLTHIHTRARLAYCARVAGAYTPACVAMCVRTCTCMCTCICAHALVAKSIIY